MTSNEEACERAESTLGLLAMCEPLVKVRMRLSALEGFPLGLFPVVLDLGLLSGPPTCELSSSVSQGARE